MSDTPATKTSPPSDSLRSPQFILAMYAMTIVAGTVVGIFLKNNEGLLNIGVGFIFGTLAAGVIGFYFGSSKGSQAKDDVIAAQAAGNTTPPGTVTTTTTPTTVATVTTTTPPTPPTAAP